MIGSPGLGSGRAIVAHTIYGVDAVAAAQALSEIGYLLRQNEKERFRAKAFSAAAWSIALERPDLASLQRTENLTQIEGVGEGIARVLSDLIQNGESRYLNRLREQIFEPRRIDAAGDADQRLAGLAAFVATGVQRKEEFTARDDRFARQSHATATDHHAGDIDPYGPASLLRP